MAIDPLQNFRTKNSVKKGIEDNLCLTCKAMGNPPPCFGHGGMGGDICDWDGDDEALLIRQTLESGHEHDDEFEQRRRKQTAAFNTYKQEWANELSSSENLIQYEAGFLSIIFDKLRGKLLFQGKKGLSAEELEILNQFLHAIRMEFKNFMHALAEEGVSVNKFTADIKNNVLDIRINHPKYYAMFIRHLADMNYCPIPGQKQKQYEPEDHGIIASQKHDSYRTPFGIQTGPKPKGFKD